jgi:hypothetical protein
MGNERVHVHEAGHVIVGHVLGLDEPRSVVARSDGGHTSRFLSPGLLERLDRPSWLAWVESDGVMWLAGAAGLRALGYPDPDRGAEGDRPHAWQAAKHLDPSAPAATLARLNARAVELARTHRAAIDRFAATLAAHDGRLNGAEVTTALNRALAGEGHTLATRPPTQAEFLERLKTYNTPTRQEYPE